MIQRTDWTPDAFEAYLKEQATTYYREGAVFAVYEKCHHCGPKTNLVGNRIVKIEGGIAYYRHDNPDCPHTIEQERLKHRLTPTDLRQFIMHPVPREHILQGLFRRREVVSASGGAKACKSFSAIDIALSVAAGVPYLGRFAATQGRVCVLDNEIEPDDWSSRFAAIAKARGIDPLAPLDNLDVHNVRRDCIDLDAMSKHLDTFDPGTYSLVVVDAFYKAMPVKTSESSDTDLRSAYVMLDRMANRYDCAILIVNHTQKGSGQGKQAIDAISGHGTAARSVDCNMFFRHTVNKSGDRGEIVTLETNFRALPPLPKIPLRFRYPVWEIIDDKTISEITNEKIVSDADRLLALVTKPIKKSELKAKAIDVLKFQHRSVDPLIDSLVESGKLVASGRKPIFLSKAA